MATGNRASRVGRVRIERRGKSFYLCYHDQGRRRRPRVGTNLKQARQLAAQINGQLETGIPGLLSFEPVTIAELRQAWLEHHEYVRRSAVATLARYSTATRHLLNFLRDVRPVRLASDFSARHVEEFVRYLHTIEVASNGHPHARKRRLLDNGIKYVVETCCSLFNYALKRRHLSPYAENPFRLAEVGRLPVENARPIRVFDADQEAVFLRACDPWQFPLFLTLLLTGLRPGELIHLALPDNLDLEQGWLRIRNKRQLGWQVKTRQERDVPLVPELRAVLQLQVAGRCRGPLFRQRRCMHGYEPQLGNKSLEELALEIAARIDADEARLGRSLRRQEQLPVARGVWHRAGGLRNETVRLEFIQLTEQIGLTGLTAPKTLRHTFATMLQDANVDPLVRNELLGHSPRGCAQLGTGLGMTAVYTHTRPETKQAQLQRALAGRPAIEVAAEWARQHGSEIGR